MRSSNNSIGGLALRALLFATLVSSPALVTQAHEGIEPVESAPVDTGEIRAFRHALAGIESAQGAYAQALPEQLISLGLALQQQGRHQEAVTVFKRGGHLARINNGLFSAEQIPFLQGEISSNLAVGELAEVDQRQHYLLQVQQRSLASGDLYIEALMQQAGWQYNAYEQGIGENRHYFGRLLSMWDLYQLAISDIMDREGATSPKLLPPLNGMLKAQYLISTYQETYRRNVGNSAISELYRFNAFRSQNYKTGTSVILAIYNVQRSRFGKHGLPAVETRVMLGDWMLWHEKRQSANKAYQSAFKDLADQDDAQVKLEHMFRKPVALPDIDGIRPRLPVVAADQGDILLEFRINSRGKVIDLVRLDENEGYERKANLLMRRLRKMIFRPRFAGGEPITTEKIIRAYDVVK